MTPKDFTMKMAGLTDYLNGSVMRGLEDLGSTVVDMNVHQMEIMGEDSRGVKFGDYAVRSYEIGYPQLKQAMGREGRFINLHNDGHFHEGINAKISGASIELESTDKAKTDKFLARWPHLLGLNEDNMDELVDLLVDHIADELTTYFV